MPDAPAEKTDPAAADAKRLARAAKKHRRWRFVRRTLGVLILLLIAAGVVGRIYLGTWVTWYVNRVIDQNKLYDGKIDSIDINLWKGEYSIHNIRLLKQTGNIAQPFFACDRLDIAVDWNALRKRKIKANAYVERPKINFVQGPTESQSQNGAAAGAGPWLGLLRDLAPFDINSAVVHQGELHFSNNYSKPQVDIYLNRLDVLVKNLTNIEDTTTPLNARVDITGTAMDSGKFECHVKFDPFSYRPSFDLAMRLDSLDVQKLNPFTKAYGDFDFEAGYFDLVVELTSKEGLIDGYTKPLFRDMRIFGRRDFKEDIFNVFWQALLGTGNAILTNPPRDQFGTRIPIAGRLDAPKPEILTTVFNVLRNAFIRAYLPRLEGNSADLGGLQFKPGEITAPTAASGNP